MANRINLKTCCGVIIDVQDHFLKTLKSEARERLEVNMMGFAKMLAYLRIPTLATIERPLDKNGSIPENIARYLNKNEAAEIFEKDYFDLTKHKDITGYLRSLKRKQMIIAGAETDVCVLQSALGLMNLGYEVFLVEDLLFSASADVSAALERLRDAGAVRISLRTLYYELLEAVESSPRRNEIVEKFGPPLAEI